MIDGYLFTGELSLDGKIKLVRGALSMTMKARDVGLKGVLIPEENASEAAVVKGIPVFGVKSLPEVIEFLKNDNLQIPFEIDVYKAMEESALYEDDFSDVKGQEHAKRALEVAAAGGHNVLTL